MEFTSLGKRLVEKVWSWDNISFFGSHCNPCLFILRVLCMCMSMRVLVGLHFKKILMGFLWEGSITKGIKSRCKTAVCRIRHWLVKNKHSLYNRRDRWGFEKWNMLSMMHVCSIISLSLSQMYRTVVVEMAFLHLKTGTLLIRSRRFYAK